MGEAKLFEVENFVLKKVAELLDTTEKSLNEDVLKLEKWMKTQPHLPEIMDGKKIQNFLILNKGSVEATKSKIDMYYTVRNLMRDIFENSNPKNAIQQEIMETIYFVPLPKLSEKMYRIFVSKVRKKDKLDNFELYDLLCHSLNIQEVRMQEDVTFGDVFIVDLEHLGLKYLRKLTPMVMYNVLIVVYKRVFSSRIKAVYVTNAHSYVEQLLAICKTMFKPKFLDRIHICKDPNIIKEVFPKRILPKEYGGEEKSLEELRDLLASKFVEYGSRFDQLDKLRVDESLRPGKLENSEFLGFHGNFKKFETD